MKKTVLTFGLVSAAVLCLAMGLNITMLGDKASYGAAEIFGFASMFVALSVIFFDSHSESSIQLRSHVVGLLRLRPLVQFSTFIRIAGFF